MAAITVIVPVYNDELFIGETINCLKKQTFTNFECVIINDCSTDNSKNVINASIRSDSRFIYVENKVNIGLSATRNVGLFYARGDYIVFLDSDDILSATSLSERYTTARVNNLPHVAGSYGKHKPINEDLKEYPDSIKVGSEIVSFQSSMGDNPFVVHGPMIKKEIAIGIDGFNELLKYGAEDYDFWIRVLRHGFIFIPTGLLDCFYRQKKASMIKSFSLEHLRVATEIFESTMCECDTDYFFSIVNLKMKLPVYAYKAEEIMFIRIINFIGLSLFSKTADYEYEQVAKKIPNFCSGFPFHLSAIQTIRNGVLRKLVEISNANSGYIDNLIVEALGKIAKYSQKCITPSASVSGFETSPNNCFDYIFIPHKDYHVHIINAACKELAKYNIKFLVIDCSAQYKDEGVSAALQTTGLPYLSFPKITFGDFRTNGVVVFNDWDTKITRPAILAAKHSNLLSVAIVEGIQDYEDKDTGRVRRPYKTVDTVILPCPFDKKYFSDNLDNVHIAGMPRIQEIKTKAFQVPFSIDAPIVINVNFSYGVLETKRNSWLLNVVNACKELELPYIITQHPADTGDLSSYNISKDTMYDTILNGSILISRFSTAIIEAIAMERPVIYFNPHNERADKFLQPNGAFYIAHDKEELKKAILNTKNNIKTLSDRWPDYLSEHAGYDPNNPDQASQQLAMVMSNLLASHKRQEFHSDYTFSKNLREIFQNIAYLDNNKFVEIIFENVKSHHYENAVFHLDCFECKQISPAKKVDFYALMLEKLLFSPAYGEGHGQLTHDVFSRLVNLKFEQDVRSLLMVAYYMYKRGHTDFSECVIKAISISENKYLKSRPDVKLAIDAGHFTCGFHHFYLHCQLENLQWPYFQLFMKFFKYVGGDIDKIINMLPMPVKEYVKSIFVHN